MEASSTLALQLGKENEVRMSKASQSGSWELDLENDKLFWSFRQYQLYGYTPSSVSINKDYFFLKTTHYSELDRIAEIIQNALNNGTEYSFRRRIIKNGGRIGFAETNAKILRSESGVPIKIRGVTIDVGGKHLNGRLDYHDPEFFNIYYAKYHKVLSFEIYKMVFDEELAKDICQEVFMKSWHKIAKYDPRKGELYTWLINIARNHCKDYLKSAHGNFKRNSNSLSCYLEAMVYDGYSAAQNTEIKDLISHLSEDKRELISLLYLQGFTQEEVARIKNMPLGTVKTKSRSAIKLLRKFSQNS